MTYKIHLPPSGIDFSKLTSEEMFQLEDAVRDEIKVRTMIRMIAAGGSEKNAPIEGVTPDSYKAWFIEAMRRINEVGERVDG